MDTTHLEQVKTVVIDSIEYIRRTDVVDFYANIADKQATQFTILISVLCGIVVLLVGATWWWNFRGAKQQITDEVNNVREAFKRLMNAHISTVAEQLKDYEEKFNGFKGTLQESVNKQIDKKIAESIEKNTEAFNVHINELKEEQEKDFLNFKEKMTNDITLQRAELARIFALYCDSAKLFLSAVGWWLNAAQLYRGAKNEKGEGISVTGTLGSLKNVNVSEVNANTDFDSDTAIAQAKDIPDILNNDRKTIIAKLNEIKARKDVSVNNQPVKIAKEQSHK